MSVSSERVSAETTLRADFVDRLESSLAGADRERRKRTWYRRVGQVLPILLLIGPILGWRLTLATPDGVHVGISALAWVTFLLDIGVHADTTILAYLGLSQLPTLVGVLLLVVLTGWLLVDPRGRE